MGKSAEMDANANKEKDKPEIKGLTARDYISFPQRSQQKSYKNHYPTTITTQGVWGGEVVARNINSKIKHAA